MFTMRPLLVTAFVMAISVGIMSSQMCSVLCDLSGCSPSVAAVPAADVSNEKAGQGHSECGHHRQARQASSSRRDRLAQEIAQNGAEGRGHSHGSPCANHHDQVAVLSAGGTSVAHSYQQARLALAAPALTGVVSFSDLRGDTVARTPDRSPPRPVASVLRI